MEDGEKETNGEKKSYTYNFKDIQPWTSPGKQNQQIKPATLAEILLKVQSEFFKKILGRPTYFLPTNLIPSCLPGTFGKDTLTISENKNRSLILNH